MAGLARVGAAAVLLVVVTAGLGQDEPAEAPEETSEEASGEVAEGVAEEIEPAEPVSFWKGWDGSVAVGLNGASGNTERLSFRGEINGVRDTDDMTTTAGALYAYAKDDGDVSEDRFFTSIRNDWKLSDSKWFVFAEGSAEYDQLQDWDWRLAAAGGLGYYFIDNERTRLSGRAGLGLSKKFGGDDEDIRPEGLLGADLSHKLTERQKITAGATIYPDLSDGGEFRAVGNAAWEILIDPEVNLSLRVGIEDRYDSMPGDDSEKNDFSYFALLVWEF